jgi:hypothetical protein|tara:strand:+ start:351 stop:599 length:249 start_codon:yes stop_codon:yes gene_type:complete
MAVDFDALDLVRTENKARAYNKKLDELAQRNKQLEAQVKTLASLLGDMCVQADEDTPSSSRTEHFRNAMDSAYEYLEKEKLI